MPVTLQQIIPVLPSADIARDSAWYSEKLGFTIHFADPMYAVLYREKTVIHLQWHADTPSDPLLGGSVIRIVVDDIDTAFKECLERGAVEQKDLHKHTPWGTHEFGLFDLNRNALFFMQDLV